MGLTSGPQTFDCVDCGTMVSKRTGNGRPRVCIACGEARAISAVRAMVTRTGPEWDAYSRNRLGLPPGATPTE